MSLSDLRYEVILYWSDEDGSYIAEVPELPGCVSDGETYAEALADAEDAMRAWIETACDLSRDVLERKGRRLHSA